jgi:hypothetical protein
MRFYTLSMARDAFSDLLISCERHSSRSRAVDRANHVAIAARGTTGCIAFAVEVNSRKETISVTHVSWIDGGGFWQNSPTV